MSDGTGTAVPTPAGIYDYVLGGTHHTAADREAAEKALAAAPEGRAGIIENRAFMQRAVRFLGARGIRQYIDLGSGYPTVGAVHEIAAEAIAEPRVLYVDYDPAVVALSNQVIKDMKVTAAAYDVREPERIIESPELAELIDWSEPVAVLMAAVLHFLTDEENPARIVDAFRERMAPGSYLVLSHACFGENPGGAERGAGGWRNATSRMTIRSRETIRSFFAGLELAGPGLVTVQEWGTLRPAPKGQAVVLAGVGRLPGHPASLFPWSSRSGLPVTPGSG
jgi:O-methyltransferase involved in polyketide biosynthesis